MTPECSAFEGAEQSSHKPREATSREVLIVLGFRLVTQISDV
jgi:hypothetical protein